MVIFYIHLAEVWITAQGASYTLCSHLNANWNCIMICFRDFIGPEGVKDFPEETSHWPLMEICQRDCAADKWLRDKRRKTEKEQRQQGHSRKSGWVICIGVHCWGSNFVSSPSSVIFMELLSQTEESIEEFLDWINQINSTRAWWYLSKIFEVTYVGNFWVVVSATLSTQPLFIIIRSTNFRRSVVVTLKIGSGRLSLTSPMMNWQEIYLRYI